MNKVFNVYPRKVILNIEPGCYVFEPESATGKTYFGKSISKLSESGKLKVCYITYSRNLSVKNIIEKLDVDNFDVVF